MMKRIIAAHLVCLMATSAFGQAMVGSGNVLGNTTASRAPAADSSITLLLDRALGSTRGALIERGASGWAIVGPGTTGKPWVSGGAGADPSYATLGIVGGGTNCAAASGTCLDNITGFASTGLINRTGAGTYAFVTLPLSFANGGCTGTTQQTCFDAAAPTATRAGDVIYWNGTHWVTLAGNNSSTNFLSENASGAPVWSSAVAVLCSTAVTGMTITGTLTETTLGTCAVPANAMGANGALRITAQWSKTGTAGTIDFKLKFGGTTYLDSGVAGSTVISGRQQTELHNRNATNSQVGTATGQPNWQGFTGASTTSAIDTTSSQNVTFTCQLGNTGDTCELSSYLVELIRP